MDESKAPELLALENLLEVEGKKKEVRNNGNPKGKKT